ncbi:MAG: glycosyltransferase family 9 protein [Gammaproteobacteria bacterium]
MNRILIIKLGALGDVVMATPLIEAIMRHHADCAVTLLTTPPYAGLFAAWPGLAVHAVPRRGFSNQVAVVRWMRTQGFDRVYDLQANDRSGVWCALSGIAERVGNHARWPYTLHPPTAWRGQSHIYKRLVEVLATAGITVTATCPSLPADAATRARVDDWLAAHDTRGGPLVLLHAGASPTRPAKRWPHYGALAVRLRAAGFTVTWLGAEAERALNASLRRDGDLDASAAFDILALAELGRRAAFAVTNDSGPMHVLSAAGIPVFGLFGPSDWRRNHALGQAGRVIACVDAVPAFHGAACADCLAALDDDVVWARLRADGVVA